MPTDSGEAVMHIRVRYFASLRETLALEDENVEVPGSGSTAGALLDLLRERHAGAWSRLPAGHRILFAVNREMAGPDTSLRDGDELALFPPVTGG